MVQSRNGQKQEKHHEFASGMTEMVDSAERRDLDGDLRREWQNTENEPSTFLSSHRGKQVLFTIYDCECCFCRFRRDLGLDFHFCLFLPKNGNVQKQENHHGFASGIAEIVESAEHREMQGKLRPKRRRTSPELTKTEKGLSAMDRNGEDLIRYLQARRRSDQEFAKTEKIWSAMDRNGE